MKSSEHPPAKWLSDTAEVGDLVQLQVGGKFCFPQRDEVDNNTDGNMLFIAGGVGINPLLSMLRTRFERPISPQSIAVCQTTLLYSVKSPEELAFLEPLVELATQSYGMRASLESLSSREGRTQSTGEECRDISRFRCICCVTSQAFWGDTMDACGDADREQATSRTLDITRDRRSAWYRLPLFCNDTASAALSRWCGRIGPELLRAVVEGQGYGTDHACARLNNTRVYMCGPPPMMDSLSVDIQGLGIGPDHIQFEKWW